MFADLLAANDHVCERCDDGIAKLNVQSMRSLLGELSLYLFIYAIRLTKYHLSRSFDDFECCSRW